MKTTLTLIFLIVGSSLFSQGTQSEIYKFATSENDIGVADSQMINIAFFAPNAFTPNGDLNNDTWTITAYGLSEFGYRLTVCNVAGEVVWESCCAGDEWDGTYRGVPVAGNIFVWKLNAVGLNGENFVKEGHITVLK